MRVAFTHEGGFRLAAPKILEMTLSTLSAARVESYSRLYGAGLHKVPVAHLPSGNYILRIQGT